MGFFSDLFGGNKTNNTGTANNSNGSTNKEFKFSQNKIYRLDDLKSFLTTATGYAQHVAGCEVACSPKKGMEEMVLDPHVMASLPGGKQVPVLSLLFTSMAEETIKKKGRWGSAVVAPISRISFRQSPKTCVFEFSNPQIGESQALSFSFVPSIGMVLISALKIAKDKYAIIRITTDKTFQVLSFSNDIGGFSTVSGGVGKTETEQRSKLSVEYGTSPDDPICVRSVNEEYMYLEMLKCASSDERIANKVRLGSMHYNGVIFDKWQISIKNVRLNLNEDIILYMNPYSNRSDFSKAPSRFSIRR